MNEKETKQALLLQRLQDLVNDIVRANPKLNDKTQNQGYDAGLNREMMALNSGRVTSPGSEKSFDDIKLGNVDSL